MRIKALLVAVAAFACFVALGMFVVRQGEAAALLAWEQSLLDHSTLVAWWITWSCLRQALFPLAIVLLIVAWRVPQWRARILFSLVVLFFCWRGADLFQHVFARPRPAHWVVKHETAFSYPSTHAAIAAGFYGLWAVMLYASDLPRWVRVSAASLLGLFAVAICWSRLALGAHYFTDLLGGALLALTIVSLARAVVPVRLFGPLAGRVSAAAE